MLYTKQHECLSNDLIKASQSGNLNKVNMILAKENLYDINSTDTNGATALFRAVQNKHYDIVQALLLKGADPNINCKGVPAVLIAYLDENILMLKLLIYYGASIKIRIDNQDESLIDFIINASLRINKPKVVYQEKDIEDLLQEGNLNILKDLLHEHGSYLYDRDSEHFETNMLSLFNNQHYQKVVGKSIVNTIILEKNSQNLQNHKTTQNHTLAL